MAKMLTKSKYIAGLQCLRYLWFYNQKKLPEIPLYDQIRMEGGADFEKYARKLFPKARDNSELGFIENIQVTKNLIKNKKNIIEAGLRAGRLYARSDVLEYKGNDNWYLYEIKSSNSVKKQHYPDLGFQKYICEKNGLHIEKCFVIHMNRDFKKKGRIDPKNITVIEEVTEQVNLVDDIEKNSKKFLAVIDSKQPPLATVSRNCNGPYSCPLKEECWKFLPKNNIFLLKDWRTYWKLFDKNILDLKDIPKDFKLKQADKNIRDATLNKKVYVSKEHIKHFLKTIKYPIYHFDFETFATAVPIYDNSSPHQNIPFQYSLHVEDEKGDIKHFEYLAEGDKDPRIKLLEQLKNEIGTQGSVLVYNQSFEIGVFENLAIDFPEHKQWIDNVLNRIIDLAVPFKNFYYYNPKQKGRWSLKKVLPALTELSYKGMGIDNGGDASALFFYTHIKKTMKGKEKVRKYLLKYCELDTYAMVEILDKVEGMVKLIF